MLEPLNTVEYDTTGTVPVIELAVIPHKEDCFPSTKTPNGFNKETILFSIEAVSRKDSLATILL